MEKKGRKEGKPEGIQKVALEMLKKGFSIELIAEVTKLDEKEILDLKENFIRERKTKCWLLRFLWTF